MIPFEREIYLGLLEMKLIREENERIERQNVQKIEFREGVME